MSSFTKCFVVPPELGGLAKLEFLSLLNNDLSGSLPSDFGRLASLMEMDLTNNAAIFGTLPASLTGLRNLKALYARGTGLCVPDDADLRAWLDGVPEAQVAPCAPAAAYLVQAVQSRTFPVPLVAGDEALLRVFITADQGAEARIPPVRARFYLDGSEAHVVEIPAGSRRIPAEVDESDPSLSANAVVPADVVRPGLEMVVEIDPGGTLDPGLGVAERIPATGRLAIEVREMPRFDLTVIPFLWASEPDASVIAIAEGMAADPEGHDLLQATRTLLPVADIAVTMHAPVTSLSRSSLVVLRETAAIRALEGGGHYMGLMAQFFDAAGRAQLGGWSSVSTPYPAVIAHEFGHNMSLRHAPCGGAATLDRRYPYPDGSIGAWGYDLPGGYNFRDGGAPVHPGTYDLMGYCDPKWISDYHFTRALRHRLVDKGAAAASLAPEQGLLVWGGVAATGRPFLEPAFNVEAALAPPMPGGGEYELVGRNANGAELFAIRFDMLEVADGTGEESFAFVLPGREALAEITLAGPGGVAVLGPDTQRPMAILRESRTGSVRAILREITTPDAARAVAATALGTPIPGTWNVLFSRGIPPR